MIDTHCHLYSAELQPDISAVMERAEKAGVQQFYLPAIDISSAESMFALEAQYPGKCHAMIGLHPCSVNAVYQEELDFVKDQLQKRSFAAIGEAGLDFYWDTTFREQQYNALHEQINLALQYDLPLVLHTRNAMQETIEVVGSYKGKGLKGIFHCFGGSENEAKQIIELDFLLGIGGVVTFKKSGLDLVLKNIDLSHIVLETDAPYLSPVPYRGKRNESSYLPEVAKKIAEIKDISLAVVDEVTSANAERIFNKR